jgi:hypothetical protein
MYTEETGFTLQAYRVTQYTVPTQASLPQSTVERMLSFFSCRPNWDSPIPSPAGERVPPLWFRGGREGAHTVHTRFREREWGGSQFQRGHRPSGTYGYISTSSSYQLTNTQIHIRIIREFFSTHIH